MEYLKGLVPHLGWKFTLANNGIAVLKGYHKAPLMIKIENIERKEGTLQSCQLVLVNISDKPMAVVDLPDNGSLQLLLWSWPTSKKLQWANEGVPVKEVEDKDVRVLEPNQSYEFKINFNDPYWFVSETVKGSSPVSINTFRDPVWKNMLSFSLVYQPPPAQQCKNLKDAKLIWHGKLISGRLTGVAGTPPLY